jgi:hypothetical protein
MAQNESAVIAAHYFSVCPYCALSTVNPDDGHSPWVTPIYFSTTNDLQVLWLSALDAQHSINISKNPRVALAFYDTNTPFGNAQGLYVTGSVRTLADNELEWGCLTFYTRRFPEKDAFTLKARNPKDFREPSPRRMYLCQVERAWVLDPKGHPVYGRLLDHRVEIDLHDFREAYIPPLPPPEIQEPDARR